MPPRRIRAFGTTVIAGPNALTNAEQVVLTRVKVRSTKAKRVPGVKVIRKGSGAVLVRAKGLKGVKIVVDQSAPAIGDYREYRKRTVYVNGRP